MIDTVSYITIRPQALTFSGEVFRRICESRLSIEKVLVGNLSAISCAVMTSDIDDSELRILWTWYMTIGPVVHVLISGNSDCISEVLGVTGRHPDPLKCRVGSIRRDFSERYNWPHFSKKFYQNIVHKPNTLEEARRDLKTILGDKNYIHVEEDKLKGMEDNIAIECIVNSIPDKVAAAKIAKQLSRQHAIIPELVPKHLFYDFPPVSLPPITLSGADERIIPDQIKRIIT